MNFAPDNFSLNHIQYLEFQRHNSDIKVIRHHVSNGEDPAAACFQAAN